MLDHFAKNTKPLISIPLYSLPLIRKTSVIRSVPGQLSHFDALFLDFSTGQVQVDNR
jgi:hypothetical protein